MTGYETFPAMQVLFLSLGPGLPLLIGFGLMWRPLRNKAYAMVPFAALPALLAALSGPSKVAVEVPWFFMGSMMGLDPIGRIFLFVTALLWLAASLYSRGYLAEDKKRYRYSGYFLVSMSGNFGLILAQEFLGFYLFFSLMSFAAYGLIVHKETGEAFRAGRVYLVLVVLGEVMLFVALLLIASTSGSGDFAGLCSVGSGGLLFALLFIGFGIKAGALPLHVWLPLAHPVAPAPASAVLSGAMIKAGLLGWIRFLPHEAACAPLWASVFVFFGLAAVFYGVLVGLTQSNAKTVLAYSSISQMGFMTIIIGFGLQSPKNWNLAAAAAGLYGLHHGLAKGCLFLGAGIAAGNRNGEKMPWWLVAGLWLPALALAGFPFSSGAIAKSLIKEVLGRSRGPLYDLVYYFFLPLGAAGTMALLVHFLHLAGTAKMTERRENGMMAFGWFLLLVAVVCVMWLWTAGDLHAGHLLSPKVLWDGLWPVLLGLAGGMIWVRFRKGSHSRRFFMLPPGDILELVAWLGGKSGIFCRNGLNAGKTEGKGRLLRGEQAWAGIKPALRLGRAEKVLQRWAVVAGIYLAVFMLFFLVFSWGLYGFP
ncbi:MAG: complex I subunit 5 family protein [Pseudomonadota bacterium]